MPYFEEIEVILNVSLEFGKGHKKGMGRNLGSVFINMYVYLCVIVLNINGLFVSNL